MSIDINWTKSGNTAFTTHGWMISRTHDGAYLVFNADSQFVGQYSSRRLAEMMATK